MIRKLLFLFFFFLGISIISIIFLPSLIMPTKIVLFGGKIMGRWAAVCLRIFLQTKIVVKGKENIIKNEKFFIACSHQSMFETFYLQTIFNSPVFILKRELLLKEGIILLRMKNFLLLVLINLCLKLFTYKQFLMHQYLF